MNLQGERLIPASVDRTWDALNDPETLKACIAGCESIERTAENQYLCTMAVRIGPVNARFKGKLQLSDIVATESYRINFDGQGGVAGFGKGHADVRLAAEGDDATRLSYKADAQVGGKIAQIGSRLVESAAAKIADDFFKAFEARMTGGGSDAAAPAVATAPATSPGTAPATAPATGGVATDRPAPEGTAGSTGTDRSALAGAADAGAATGAATFGAAGSGNAAAGAAVAGAASASEAASARAGLPGSERAMGATVQPPTPAGSRGTVWWIVGIIVLVLVAWLVFG